MLQKLAYALMVLLVIVTCASALWAYPLLPDSVVSHWNASGEPDGYMNKAWGTFLLPGILLALLGLFTLLPKIDPYKKNISDFKFVYNLVLLFIVAFLSYMHGLSLAWNLGATFDFTRWLSPALGVLFMAIGAALPYTKRNWFLGIRTPWTLLSDNVWEKTHKVGMKVFVTAGFLIAFLGIVAPTYVFLVAVAGAVFLVLWSMVYSYYLYKKES